MGGSAAGGDLVRCLFEANGTVPFFVNRDYTLPNYVGLGDLVFCASYSGNTEETLSAYALAKRAGAHIVVISSGGLLGKQAMDDGFSYIKIPGGQPPRTAMGYMMIPLLVCCEKFNLIPFQDYAASFDVLDACRGKWEKGIAFDKNEAKQIAAGLHGKLAVIYGLGGWQSALANRWKGQINENAKNMVFANAYPELDHNEILGWVASAGQGVAKWAGVVLEDGNESPKMKARAKVTESSIGSNALFTRVRAEGTDLLQRMLYAAYLADFVSLYLAALNGVDPYNMDAIEGLKSELAKVD